MSTDMEIIEVLKNNTELRYALQVLLIQFGEYKDGDGAAKLHAINIAEQALLNNPSI